MPNSREISQAAWAHARECLIFYFSRRHARPDAEDLAQETLLTLWNSDYSIEKDEDFLKVCYGFARHIAQQGFRERCRHEGSPVDPEQPARNYEWGSQRSTEARMFLAQVCEIGQAQLPAVEWQIIQAAAGSEEEASLHKLNTAEANRMRVRLHRARRKLAGLVGLGGAS
jgi:DNA-directed RNA polymerase specialized sigma24 family protein